MRYLSILTAGLFFTILFSQCDRTEIEKDQSVIPMNGVPTETVKHEKTTGYCPIHIAFRSHPRPGGHCDGSYEKCPGCTCAFFICICTTFATPDPLSDAEIADIIGEAEIKLTSNNTKLSMIFYQQADSSGYIHLYNDEYFPQQVADSMHVNSILVKAGLYSVNFNTHTYGETIFDCEVD